MKFSVFRNSAGVHLAEFLMRGKFCEWASLVEFHDWPAVSNVLLGHAYRTLLCWPQPDELPLVVVVFSSPS